ncbi:carboxy-terminal kinesin 2-like [Xenia sp. Carnegie-2017]|uniref:carboxy-terminal kinesin 2-like n=1 Tax=Xenia sp. Carnegie-2017 TaxID=2897299 RepID=UPI001F03CBAF|nr:carboxy-terminal kinesin 2-like [Xenia sp. Carnegie-2017]
MSVLKWSQNITSCRTTFSFVPPKRAPLDYKGRMEDMEQYLGTLKSTQQESIQRIEILESQKHQLQGNVVMKEKEMEESSTLSKKSQQARMSFSFDKAFCPETTQVTIYQETAQLVQSVLDGYNVCIFAYGQTGSGKTFTMEGDINGRDTWGVIPRAMEQVFLSAEDLMSKGWKYEIQASFLEIYNETIRDLLGNPDSKHEIKQVTTNNGKQVNDVFVTNLKAVAVTSSDQVSSLLRKAYENRSVAATNCNDRSSRSHSVFQLKLVGSNEITGELSQGVLSLVDLAGSESISQSGSTGLRLKEAKHINQSLTHLGTVFNSLAKKASHVPYRNSKLTHLLQNSLGGNSKSLMFVNVSPREDSFQETLCSLRFATQV